MKRFNVRGISRNERFGIRDPHYLNRVSSYRGGVRL